MKIEKGKMFRKICIYCVYIIIGISIFYNIIFSINTTIFQKDYLKLFRVSLFDMKSDLMQDDVNSGDLIIVKAVESQELQEGTIIAYTVNGRTRINKIFKQEQNQYVTKSNKNYNPDIEKITYNQVIGKMVMIIPGCGFVISILQSQITTGCILIFLVLYFLYNKYLFLKKQERIRKKKSM